VSRWRPALPRACSLSVAFCSRSYAFALCLRAGIVVPPLPEYPRLADASPWTAEGGLSDGLGFGFGSGGGGGAAVRSQLQSFCVRVAAHPLLRECPDLALFLSSAGGPGGPGGAGQAGPAWADALRWYERATAAVVGPAVASAVTSLLDSFAARADLLLAGASVSQSVSGGQGGAWGGIEEDAVHADASAYVTALEQQLGAAAQAA